jgi:hypothetical protein
MIPSMRNCNSLIALAGLLVALFLASPGYCQITGIVAENDGKSILEKELPLLKDELERSFPREEAVEKWGNRIRKDYPSLLYMIITNHENTIVYSFFKEAVAQQSPELRKRFQVVNKYLMEEGMSRKEVAGIPMVVSQCKLVIEMDTYYLELSFGPIR